MYLKNLRDSVHRECSYNLLFSRDPSVKIFTTYINTLQHMGQSKERLFPFLQKSLQASGLKKFHMRIHIIPCPPRGRRRGRRRRVPCPARLPRWRWRSPALESRTWRTPQSRGPLGRRWSMSSFCQWSQYLGHSYSWLQIKWHCCHSNQINSIQ